MKSLFPLFETTVGQKVIAALTGLSLLGFLIAHLAGNLTIFAGSEPLNAYAAKLKSLGPLLWTARIGLLGLFLLHIILTVRLRIRNRKAKSEGYARRKTLATSHSSRWMIFSGSAIVAFVVFHLLHFTFGWLQPESFHLADSRGQHDVYSMIVAGFENWIIAFIYVSAMVLVGSHLSHAMFSVFRSLGISTCKDNVKIQRVAQIVSIAIVLGFASIPIAVLLGMIRA